MILFSILVGNHSQIVQSSWLQSRDVTDETSLSVWVAVGGVNLRLVSSLQAEVTGLAAAAGEAHLNRI